MKEKCYETTIAVYTSNEDEKAFIKHKFQEQLNNKIESVKEKIYVVGDLREISKFIK